MPDPSWSWALVSSPQAVAEMGFAPDAAALPKNAVEQGGSLHFFPDIVVLMGQGEPNAAWARGAAERVQLVSRAMA